MGRFKKEVIYHSISDNTNYRYEHSEFLFCKGHPESLGESVQQLNDFWCFIFANQLKEVVLIFLDEICSKPQIILEVYFVLEITSIFFNLDRGHCFKDETD